MAIDPAFAETHTELYVAAGRRYTSSSNDSLVVYEGGALVLVHNSEVEQRVQDGTCLGPGVPYVAPAGGGNQGMPPVPASGITKRSRFTASPSLSTVSVPAPSSPGKVITLPSAPTDAGSIYVEVNGRGYLGPAIVAVNGAAVTLSFTVLPSDVITATYR